MHFLIVWLRIPVVRGLKAYLDVKQSKRALSQTVPTTRVHPSFGGIIFLLPQARWDSCLAQGLLLACTIRLNCTKCTKAKGLADKHYTVRFLVRVRGRTSTRAPWTGMSRLPACLVKKHVLTVSQLKLLMDWDFETTKYHFTPLSNGRITVLKIAAAMTLYY